MRRHDAGRCSNVVRDRRCLDARRTREEARRPHPDRRRSPARHGSPGTRASRARRGSPSGPAQTTAIGVRPSSSRSDEMSSDAAAPPVPSSAPRCTPPIPPVAKTEIPAAARGDHRCGNGGRGPAALGEGDGETRACRLPHRTLRRRRQRLERDVVQADEQPPVANGDRRRDGTRHLPDRGLRGGCDLEVLRVRQTVADERRIPARRPAGPRPERLTTSGAMTSRSATDRPADISEAYRRRYAVAHAPSPDDARRHPRDRGRRGARPLGRWPDRRRRPSVDQGQPLSRPPVRDRPGVGTRRADASPADPRHDPRHQAAHLPGRDHGRIHPDRSGRRRFGRGDRRSSISDGPSASGWRGSVRTAASARSPGRPMAVDSPSPPRSIRRVSSRAAHARSRVAGRRRARTLRRRSPGTSPGSDWRWDEEGHRDRWAHLFVLDTPGGRPRQVTERRLGRRRYRLASRRPHDRVLERPRPGGRPSPAADDLGRRRRRRRR